MADSVFSTSENRCQFLLRLNKHYPDLLKLWRRMMGCKDNSMLLKILRL